MSLADINRKIVEYRNALKTINCPKCLEEVKVTGEDRAWCPKCGALFFDNWLGIWRVMGVPDED
jgi:RNA polymerase subunit RPABC4/transcription elongation factor Spt4